MKPPAGVLPQAAVGPRLLSSTSHELARVILTVLHILTYLPLVLLPVMQDAHLKLVIVINTSLCLCLMAGNVCFHSFGIVKVGVLLSARAAAFGGCMLTWPHICRATWVVAVVLSCAVLQPTSW